MSESEFAESVEAAITVTSDRLRRRLFIESQLYVKQKDNMECVPTLRLARIL